MDSGTIKEIRQKYRSPAPVMVERVRRPWAASEASALGWDGATAVAQATGLSWNTIKAGMRELELRAAHPNAPVEERIRRSGAGRKRLTEIDPNLLAALESLVDPATRGHPESPLRWTCKSTAALAEELRQQNHPVSDRTVATMLKEAGYSLQANCKTREGNQHPDRNAQFQHINDQVLTFHRQRW